MSVKKSAGRTIFERDDRVAQVRDLLLKGYHRKAIADELGISYYSVNALVEQTGLMLTYLTLHERQLLAEYRRTVNSLPLAAKTAA